MTIDSSVEQVIKRTIQPFHSYRSFIQVCKGRHVVLNGVHFVGRVVCCHRNSPAWCGRTELGVSGWAWCPSNTHHPLVRRRRSAQTLHITYTASVGGREKKIPLSESRRYFWQPGRAQKLARKRNAGERRMQCRTGNMAGTMVIYLKANPKIQKMCRLFSSSLHLALMSGFAAVWSSASLTHTHTHTGCGRPMLRTLWPHLNAGILLNSLSLPLLPILAGLLPCFSHSHNDTTHCFWR